VKRFLIGLFAFAAVACQSDCESANEKIEGECSDEIARAHRRGEPVALPLTGGSEECNEDEECIAECINDADCASIAYVIFGGHGDPNTSPPEDLGPFLECLGECDPRIYDPP
jgi:hypothetical protein